METGSDTESERGNQREGIREGDELAESRQSAETREVRGCTCHWHCCMAMEIQIGTGGNDRICAGRAGVAGLSEGSCLRVMYGVSRV